MINLLPDNYVVGVDCYFRGGAPVNAKNWEFFKTLADRVKPDLWAGRKVVIGEQLVRESFNDLLHMIHGTVLRDGEYQFVEYCRSLGLRAFHDPQNYQFIIEL